MGMRGWLVCGRLSHPTCENTQMKGDCRLQKVSLSAPLSFSSSHLWKMSKKGKKGAGVSRWKLFGSVVSPTHESNFPLQWERGMPLAL